MTHGTHPLLQAVNDVLAVVASDNTAHAYSQLSSRYRDECQTDPDISAEQVAAYGIARLPATLASATRVLADLQQLRPDWAPVTALDIGAGPGTAGWAAALQFPSLTSITFVERAGAMAELGRGIAVRSDIEAVRQSTWLQDAESGSREQADLVLASYVFGEIDTAVREDALRRWWRSSRDCLVLIEPGTPSGAERLHRARALLSAQGAHVIAPCSSGTGCGSVKEWCHFAARVQRSAAHRIAKGGTLGYEDEKYTYLIASRSPADARPLVISDPDRRTGHVRLSLCADGVHETTVVSKRYRELYRWARDARWGDRMPSAD